jgi:hypothetical protein
MLRKIPFVVAIFVAASVLHPELASARSADPRISKLFGQDTMRVPYTAGRLYEIRLIPGAPFAVELPAGETAKNIWFDQRWWAAESTPGSSRIFLRALGTEDVVGRKGFIHIETEPSDYRISLHVVGVADTTDVGAGLEIYVERQCAPSTWWTSTRVRSEDDVPS